MHRMLYIDYGMQNGVIQSTPSNVYGMFSNADLEFEDAVDKDGNKHPLTQGTFIKYLESDDRELRRSAFRNLYKAYGNFKSNA